ncbi:uncharacterized protein LOC111893554 [Lactuca sativa]|uniref:uncharacterized protein LOC111893554 n=1 Tax=Lactuca sativa TaxID=4236 RepID=UPI0022AEAE63|nr:uncharacterized protein LOC111893554 [Lactuca sativa]
MVNSLYESKKLTQALGLPVELIDTCRSGCMIYWRGDKDLDWCKFCNALRYKKSRSSSTRSRIPFKRMHYFPLTPRLKRLYASQATAASMRWHAKNHGQDIGVMCHPSDSEDWKQFDISYPVFAAERRNVRLALCTNGFQPHGASGKQYSSWPIIITPYNLPPSMCMKEPYMFLTAIVPGPANPKQKLDVFLQPVVAELKQLWEEGVLTYDVSLRQNFQLRATLMWTISDFPAYGMLSGWTTAGKLACPHYGKHTQAFRLQNEKIKFIKNRVEKKGPPPSMNGEETIRQIEELGLLKVTELNAEAVNKSCGKYGWKKRSIFWDLPYWKTNLIRHNFDVMHIEKNFFENLFYTVMDVKKRTKDNANARDDLKLYCKKRKGVNQNQRAYYALEKKQKKVICEWVESLSFPDGYVSNLGRCVDLSSCRLFGMKSHDCHVFMQRLLPVAFREMLPKNVWEAVTELSLFFKSLTSKIITTKDMERIEAEIPIILCKLEIIFFP